MESCLDGVPGPSLPSRLHSIYIHHSVKAQWSATPTPDRSHCPVPLGVILRYGAIISRNQPFECRLHRRKTSPSISSQYARMQRDHSWSRVSRANAFLHLSRLKGHMAVPFTDPTMIDVGKTERAQRSLACRGARPSILIAVQSLVCSASAQHRQTI